MTGSACVVFDETLVDYNFGPGHPMTPVRVDLTMRLAKSLRIVGEGGMPQVPAPVATEDVIAKVHSEGYIETVRKVERLLYLSEYKRRQAAPGVKVTKKNFGRDRRYPIVNRFRDAGEVPVVTATKRRSPPGSRGELADV